MLDTRRSFGTHQWPPGTVAGLALVVATAWATIVVDHGHMHPDAPGFVTAWTIMMAAMMLPSAAPLVLLYRKAATPGRTAQLVSGYLIVWASAGAGALVLIWTSEDVPRWLALGVAGLYQLTPLNSACLDRCRTPADFLIQRWRRSPFVPGLDYGLWCLGCCWALMIVLVAVGMMGIGWVLLLTALVAIEKLTAPGRTVAAVSGLTFALVALVEVPR